MTMQRTFVTVGECRAYSEIMDRSVYELNNFSLCFIRKCSHRGKGASTFRARMFSKFAKFASLSSCC